MYYDKSKISDAQVGESWEGILEAASVAEKQALSITGTDGFNNSFLLLAVDEETKSSSLEMYKDGMFENNYATGADVLSFIKYGQKTLFGSTYGAKRPSDSGLANGVTARTFIICYRWCMALLMLHTLH